MRVSSDVRARAHSTCAELGLDLGDGGATGNLAADLLSRVAVDGVVSPEW